MRSLVLLPMVLFSSISFAGNDTVFNKIRLETSQFEGHLRAAARGATEMTIKEKNLKDLQIENWSALKKEIRAHKEDQVYLIMSE